MSRLWTTPFEPCCGADAQTARNVLETIEQHPDAALTHHLVELLGADERQVCQRAASALLKVAFVRLGKPLYAYLLPADLRKELHPRTVDLAIPDTPGAAINTPVLIDPLAATVHRLPSAKRSNRCWQIPTVPLSDCPLIITDRSTVELGNA